MKYILPFLLILFVAFFIGCSSDDEKKSITSPDDEPVEEPTLFGFWEMVDVAPMDNKPISFGADSICQYVHHDCVYHYSYRTFNDTLIIFYPSFAQYTFLLDGDSLFLYSESDTLIYERPEPEATISIVFEFGYIVPEGYVEIVATNPSEQVERLIFQRPAGSYTTQWFPDGDLEDGPYAIDIYYDLNDTTWMVQRRYIQLER